MSKELAGVPCRERIPSSHLENGGLDQIIGRETMTGKEMGQ
jgi:hypothetical protein